MDRQIPAVELIDIEHRYGRTVALALSRLEISQGETVAVMGPNGSGKSTLLRLIGLLERPVRGKVVHWGSEAQSPGARLRTRRRTAMVFQDPLLFRGTVADNVAYGLRIRKWSRLRIRDRVRDTLDLLGIGHLWDRSSAELSGGEAQRTALARALAVEPDLFLLDEPTAYLDAPSREAFASDLMRLARRLGLTVVYVTHDRAEARLIGDRALLLLDGRLEQQGPVDDVLCRPVSARAAEFVGSERLGTARVLDEGWAEIGGHRLALELGGERGMVDLYVRPEDVILGPCTNGARLVGTISRLQPAGAWWRVDLDCGPGLVVPGFVSGHQIRSWGLAVGSDLAARLDPDRVHALAQERRSMSAVR